MRAVLRGLRRYVATVQVSKHRFFVFIDAPVLPDHGLFAIASDQAYVLGVLSSAVHRKWALITSGTLEDRPYWNNSQTFEPFPFPEPSTEVRSRIEDVAEQLDYHRKRSRRFWRASRPWGSFFRSKPRAFADGAPDRSSRTPRRTSASPRR